MQEAGRKVLGDLKPRDTQIDRVWPMDRFKHEAARLLGQDSGLTDSDVRILLVHLSRDKSQVAYDDQVGELKTNFFRTQLTYYSRWSNLGVQAKGILRYRRKT